MPILASIVTLLSLMIGLMAGEMVALRAFGRPKRSIILLDMVFFVIVISTLFTFINFTALGLAQYAVNFVIGIGSVLMVRGLETGLRLTERPGAEHKIAANIIRELSKHGLDEDEIKGVLQRSGISPKTVDRLSDMIQSSVPAYVPKLVKMEMDIAEIRQGIDNLSSRLRQPGVLKGSAAPRTARARRTSRRR